MATSTEHGVGFVTRFLEQAGVSCEVVEHEPVYTAADEAAATHADERYTAKTLVLHDREGWRVAVLPANHRLDLDKARRLLGGTRHLRLATEEEMAEAFPAFDPGAMPPVGAQLPEVVDVRLLYRDTIVCAGGDHTHSIRLDPRDLLKLAEPRVGDICEHAGPPHRKDFANLPKV
ncbi:MAG TPA: YbaK/EbsC family protein [Solirubrobacter sp.]|jgi:Ala-tRNA(Pro) deacylase|nr:YbaK/EbsC family protein [Solirubrobacter sp.]